MQTPRTTIHSALLAIALAAAAWGPAAAQGFYYKEIVKEGRIYVFNNAREAELFEQVGEMGRALTRPGAGPNGETVIGDSERALQLFFFKHGIAEAVPEPRQPTMRVEWRDGKTRVTTDNAYLEMSNRVQVRYTQEYPDDAVQLAGTSSPGDSRGSFRIRRAKFKLEGWFWKPNSLTYELQLNWPANAAGASNPGAYLEDANIAWDPQGKGKFRVLLGQFKPPFGRQELTSSGNQTFVDRSIVSNEYARGRDTGAAVQGVLFGNRLEYRAGVFNGNGLTRTANDNASFQVNGRLMWQPNGSQNLVQRAWVSGALYSEGDFESTTTPIYAVAVNVERNDFHGTTTGNDLKSTIVGVDGVFKYKGFFGTGEYYWRERDPETGSSFNANGWFLQASQMLNRRRTWEAGVRYASRDVNDTIANNDVSEIRGGVSYYYRRHTLKFQADVGQVKAELGPTATRSRKDRELRLQTQFIF
jgi:phosphate-selective porin OprO/OprP